MEEEAKPVLIQYIHDRVLNKNKNFLMVLVGSTGSGKSYAGLRLAELIDPSFTIDRCTFKAKDFMQQINKLTNSKEDIKGKCIIWDELGVEHSAREFMTLSNRVINYFFQTCRSLNLVVILTVPLLSFIDSNTRKLCHCIAETQGINRRKKQNILKVKMNQTNVLSGKEYPKFLRYTKNNKKYSLKKARVNFPSKELVEPYEVKKRLFNEELNQKILRELDRVEEKDRKKNKALTPAQEEIAELLTNMPAEEVAKKKNISLSGVYAHKTHIEKKGYLFKPIWEDKRIICYNIEGFKANSSSKEDTAHY